MENNLGFGLEELANQGFNCLDRSISNGRYQLFGKKDRRNVYDTLKGIVISDYELTHLKKEIIQIDRNDELHDKETRAYLEN